MSKDLNVITVIGRLTRNPNIRETASGKKMALFTIANADDYKQDGQLIKNTYFISCEAFGRIAEIVEQYTEKGKQVAIVGKMYVREREKDGTRTWYSGISVSSISLLADSRGAGEGAEIKMVVPREEYDPSEYLNKFGPTAFDTEEEVDENLDGDVEIPF